MKTAKLVLVVTLLTIVLVANRFAGTTHASKNESSIYKQIEQQMPYPEFAKSGNLKGKVMVEFRLAKNGRIEVLNINYSSLELKNYVADRLEQMNLVVPEGTSEQVYRVAFSFSLLS